MVPAIRASCKRFRIRVLYHHGEGRLRPRIFYPEPEGEFLNQSKTIIGTGVVRGNLS